MPAITRAQRIPSTAASVVGAFLFLGCADAVWAVAIPDLTARLRLDNATLGLVLLTANATLLLAMWATGRYVDRLGAHRVLLPAGLTSALLLAGPWLASSPATLTVAVAVLGAAKGTLLVAANARAARWESDRRRPLMNTFHAMYSLGVVAGVIAGSLLLALGVGPTRSMVAVGVGYALFFATGWLRPLGARCPRPGPTAGPATRAPTLGTGVLLLGLLGLCTTVAEVAVLGWSALYLQRELRVPAALAPYGYALFALAAAVGRLYGDAGVARLGPTRFLGWAGAVAAAGLTTAALVRDPVLAVAALGVSGAGLAGVLPLLLSLAGRLEPGRPGRATAGTGLLAQLGTVVGPALVGLAAQASTVRAALLLPALLCLLLTVVATTARGRGHAAFTT